MAVQANIGSWTVTWPWPRALFLSHYILGFAKEEASLLMFEMSLSDGTWSAVAVKNLGDANLIDQVSVADFGTFYIVSVLGINSTSGSLVAASYKRDVSKDPEIEDCIDTMLIADGPTFGTTCNFNGRCLGGAISSTKSPWDSLGMNAIVWSGIGNLEFDAEVDVTAGFGVMPWASYNGSGEGVVFKILKIGKSAAVYGDGGKVLLTPALVGNTAALGMKDLYGLGIASGNHVAGNDHVHGFIDLDRYFWLLDAEGELTKLGYKEYMSELLDYTHTSNDYRTIVSYLPKDKRFYVSNGNKCYVITEHGAYSTHQLVNSIGHTRGGNLWGFYIDSLDVEGRIVTDRLDFGIRGIKTISALEVGSYHPSGSNYAAVDWRVNKSAAFQRSSWTVVNPDGVATPIVAGDEIRLCVKFDDYVGVELDYITSKVKITDRRYMRGPVARKMEDITE